MSSLIAFLPHMALRSVVRLPGYNRSLCTFQQQWLHSRTFRPETANTNFFGPTTHSFKSQGAQVIHLGVAKTDAKLLPHVVDVVLFGDPYDKKPLPGIDPGRITTFCHKTDLICKGISLVLPSHLLYGDDGDDAATFVTGRLNITKFFEPV